jgi:HSP20 family molecular chaperone IbpA
MIPLPDGAQAEQAKAEFKDGVLQVRVPISEQHRKSRQIPIGG